MHTHKNNLSFFSTCSFTVLHHIFVHRGLQYLLAVLLTLGNTLQI